MNNLVDIKDYTKRLTDELKAEFGDRLLYIGLQGSYLRGEGVVRDCGLYGLEIKSDADTYENVTQKSIL